MKYPSIVPHCGALKTNADLDLPPEFPTEHHIVMAQQDTVNVDPRVGQSVVDSTTGVDTSTKASPPSHDGGKPENQETIETSKDELEQGKSEMIVTEPGITENTTKDVKISFKLPMAIYALWLTYPHTEAN